MFFVLSYHKCPPRIKIENFQITVYRYAYNAKNCTILLVMLLMCICLYFCAHLKCQVLLILQNILVFESDITLQLHVQWKQKIIIHYQI
jgi:hypothetical protein